MRDQPLGVLGTGTGSVEYAHLLHQWTDDVILFAHTQAVAERERATLVTRGIAVVEGSVERLVVSDDRLRAVELADGDRARASRSSSARRYARIRTDRPPRAGLRAGRGRARADRQRRAHKPR